MDAHAKLTPTGTELLKGKGDNFKKYNGADNTLKLSESAEPKEDPKTDAAPKVKKIALVGTAPSSRDLAPYHDPSWEIWVCSPGNAHGVIPRVNVWFEVHSNLLWPEHASYGRPYIEWLKQQSFPIYMQNQSMVPNAIPLPIGELIQEFGRYFFTSSFAYMLAMAIKAGATEIAMYGIDMASKDEYILQRPGGHYFMQEAAKRGIKVSVPYESDLAQPPALYGYGDSTPFGRKLFVRRKEIEGRVAAMKAERDKLNTSITYLEGAQEDMQYIESIWSGLQT